MIVLSMLARYNVRKQRRAVFLLESRKGGRYDMYTFNAGRIDANHSCCNIDIRDVESNDHEKHKEISRP